MVKESNKTTISKMNGESKGSPDSKFSAKLAEPVKTLIETKSGQEINLEKINLSEAKVVLDAQNLTIKLPNGLETILVDFVQTAKQDNPPQLKIAGDAVISAPELLDLLAKIGAIQTAEGLAAEKTGSAFSVYEFPGELPGIRPIGLGLDAFGKVSGAGLDNAGLKNLR